MLPFTRDRAAQEAADFVREVLVGRLHARHIVVGRNFRFGHRASGDVTLLVALGVELGFAVTVGSTWSWSPAPTVLSRGPTQRGSRRPRSAG